MSPSTYSDTYYCVLREKNVFYGSDHLVLPMKGNHFPRISDNFKHVD